MMSRNPGRSFLLRLALLPLVGIPLGLSASPVDPALSGFGASKTPSVWFPDQGGGQAPEDLPEGQACATASCHPGINLKMNQVHGPVAVGQCEVCHVKQQPDKHRFKPIQDMAKLCASCHALNLRKNIHKPLQEGQCTACHDPHQSESKFLLSAPNEKELCGKCHEQSKGLAKKFVHGPVAAGACSLCHNPHSSFYPRLLNKKGSGSCLKCHTELEQALKGATFWHKPVSEDCSQCHDSHASDFPFQLRNDRKALCLDCHTAKKEEIQASAVYHEALTLNEGCQNCHNTHASKFPKLLDQPTIDLCLKCHDKPQVRKDKTVITAVGKELENSKFLHGPIREGNCSGCHNPHGSKNFRLLRKDYPKNFYAPFKMKTYNLCFGCHDSKVFTEEKTLSRTHFRNGDQNLHFLHVNKDTKGRTCRACHKTHASNLPKHMARSVPFGGWEIPINFELKPGGGSCAPGCHAPKRYSQLEAIDNSVPAAPEKKESRGGKDRGFGAGAGKEEN